MENNIKKKLKIFYVHGLEGSYKGFKGQYLSKKFDVKGIEMNISILKPNAKVNALQAFFSNFCKLKFYKAFSRNNIVKTMVYRCVKIQKNEAINFDMKSFDVFVGSSWGATVLLELMKEEEIIPIDKKILLLSPANYKMLPKFQVTERMKEFTNVKIIHSKKDERIPIEHAIKLSKELINCKLVKVDDVHGLYDMIKTYEKGSLYDEIINF